MNTNNVYSGADSLKQYFDPDFQPMLPLVELPAALNPFLGDKVRIYAKMMTALPAQNVKCLPSLNMLSHADPAAATRTIIEPSSGSTITSMSMISRALYNNPSVVALVSNKTELARLRQLQFFGLEVSLYGGPAQPEIEDPRGIVAKARRIAEEDEEGSYWNPGQYENDHNPAAHVRWTGPQLLTQLPQLNVFCAGMGSAGCMTGTGTYLKRQKPSITTIAVCNITGDSIPGPRPLPLFRSIKFPWETAVDAVEEVASVESYRLSMELSRYGLICGPSSGMALRGLFNFLGRAKEEGTLGRYAEPESGEVNCVFLCCDLPYQYLDNYFKKLGPEDFHPIVNEQLLEVDTDPYDSRWELSPSDIMSRVFPHEPDVPLYTKIRHNTSKNTINSSPNPHRHHTTTTPASPLLLDLRQPPSFHTSHLLTSQNHPLPYLHPTTLSPFNSPTTLSHLWKSWTQVLDADEGSLKRWREHEGGVLLLCYDGEASRLFCSMLRGRGVVAWSVRGGVGKVLEVEGRGGEGGQFVVGGSG